MRFGQVTGQLPGAEKALLTTVTVVSNFAMRQSMPVVGRFTRKLNHTDRTLVLLGEVHPQVFANRTHVLLLAQFAAVQFDAFLVDSSGVVRSPVVLRFANSALIVLLVHPQEGSRRKCPPTNLTLVVPAALVDGPDMVLVGVDSCEALQANRTLVTAGLFVNS
ncbi:AAEL003166-PA [Aedes aegypti]|uniref:AAEL003166-PA n=1 Tax=Aedes aegypti TaxID=7159 RepID=Q17G77_AEDAE|nr:AAEL003166-PA [Aedes aegypti]